MVGERSTVNKDITQIVEVHEDADKFMRLLQLLGVWYERGSVLVFVETQEKCDQLFADLLKVMKKTSTKPTTTTTPMTSNPPHQ